LMTDPHPTALATRRQSTSPLQGEVKNVGALE
jgi:hypothetical protein